MKVSVGKLKREVARAVRGRISASPEYMKKEFTRSRMQEIITDAVGSGDIVDEEDLRSVIEAMKMAVDALALVPLDVWKRSK